MVILKQGKKLPQDYAHFICPKCECEWLEDVTKIFYTEEDFDPYLLTKKVKYIMTCPNCEEEEVKNTDIKRIVLDKED